MKILSKIKSIFNNRAATKLEEKFYVSICCIIKDENEYISEWITYHTKVGVEHFFLFDNDSKIPIQETINQLGYQNITTVVRISGKSMHIKAYQQCIKKYGHTSAWIAFIDTDEFIVPKVDGHSLPVFLKDYEMYGGVGLSWLIFGSNGHKLKPAGSQLHNFTMRSEATFGPNQHIKSIVQPKFVESAYKSHCFKYKSGYHCVNEKFEIIDGSTSPNSVEKIQLNHYYCRSSEEFEQKIKRGFSDTKRARLLEEFIRHDQESNKIEDLLILKI